ncbi:probable outer membrane protein pmp20 isoform X2 [Dysidea avara]|uniref:probable outer membrane protein pmp20 isoform X2 n=1 Tax=Dysidea avara TaxID=196820 RepID=UPI003330EE58
MLQSWMLSFIVLLLQNTEGLTGVLSSTDNSTDGEKGIVSESVSSEWGKPLSCQNASSSFQSIIDAPECVTSNSVIKLTTDVVLSSPVLLDSLENITIIGYGNPSVKCNHAGAIEFDSCTNVTIVGINWIKCGSNKLSQPGIMFGNSSNIRIERCLFHNSTGQSVALSSMSGTVYLNNCNFTHCRYNRHGTHGAAIHFSSGIRSNSTELVINNCIFSSNKAPESIVYIQNSNDKHHHQLTIQNTEFTSNRGVPIYAINQNLHLRGNILFKQNKVKRGGSIFCTGSSITVDGNSTVMFNYNTATEFGGAINGLHSNFSFKGNSSVLFNGNSALDGGALHIINSTILFDDNCNVTLNDSHAIRFGGAVFMNVSTISFQGNSRVTYTSNDANIDGGAMKGLHSIISFNGNTTVVFTGNNARYGGVLYGHNFDILCNERSVVTFVSNSATIYGGAVFIDYSRLSFEDTTRVVFDDNSANIHGGAVSGRLFNISFNENSNVTFKNNSAKHGGAIRMALRSRISFDANSFILFDKNSANADGGALHGDSSVISFVGNCTVTFNANSATRLGGAIYSNDSSVLFLGNSSIKFNDNTVNNDGGAAKGIHSNILFGDSSVVTFNSNAAMNGGALHYEQEYISFVGNASVLFSANYAQTGGAVLCTSTCSMLFNESANITFFHNTAIHGGAMYSSKTSTTKFEGDANVFLSNNIASQNGGAISSFSHSSVIFTGNPNVTFHTNTAKEDGAAMYSASHCNIHFDGYSSVLFTNNTAMQHGGAVSITQSKMKYARTVTTRFYGNRAAGNGGAIHLGDNFTVEVNDGSHVNFSHNIAGRYGGAIYGGLSQSTQSKMHLNDGTNVEFHNNTARRSGQSIYLDVPLSCDNACLNRIIVGINSSTLRQSRYYGHINTSPSKLELSNPAICIESVNSTTCKTYFINDIMLGQEITIDACVKDYYNQAAAAQFFVDSRNENHSINGSKYVSISCEALTGIDVVGNIISNATNVSMEISSDVGSKSSLGMISIKLVTELSPCHSGFYYEETGQKCVCYNTSNIVSCSDSTSSIKRGYWFGSVNRKPTVAVCPNNYCNFSCCEATNGYYLLSPVRNNQCKSRRAGTACGGCEKGFTLSFDSVECVSANECTVGQTVLVVSLTLLYWVIIVVLVFAMTYYHVGIGYLYAITYYYSMLDILLSQSLYTSQRLFTTISIMSSIVKVTPQFLGQLCLAHNMSGIDQQFIHYVHPLAVTIIVVIICQTARISYKFSSFVSRGIIRLVCFLLLLSYTSVATTSLLLLRSLSFQDVDRTYTYVSPDIEYLHGRHLPYAIIAVLCTMLIVIGFPMFLLLQPLLNHKINFTRIKPLLDQLQGCYRDKYRCFAAYYMICRLVIILIIIANSSSHDTTNFLLVTACLIFALIQIILRPYANRTLNMFDGFILQFLILVTMIALVDNFSQNLLLMITYVLVFLPLIAFISMELLINKGRIRKIVAYCKPKSKTIDNNSDMPMNDIDTVIDDSMRKNATICDIKLQYRESFMEIMDDIKD